MNFWARTIFLHECDKKIQQFVVSENFSLIFWLWIVLSQYLFSLESTKVISTRRFICFRTSFSKFLPPRSLFIWCYIVKCRQHHSSKVKKESAFIKVNLAQKPGHSFTLAKLFKRNISSLRKLAIATDRERDFLPSSLFDLLLISTFFLWYIVDGMYFQRFVPVSFKHEKKSARKRIMTRSLTRGRSSFSISSWLSFLERGKAAALSLLH